LPPEEPKYFKKIKLEKKINIQYIQYSIVMCDEILMTDFAVLITILLLD
jgi:hypothetical protein